MGQTQSHLSPDEVTELVSETGFTPNQIHRLYTRFCRMDKHGMGMITAEDFMSIPELAINPLVERIIKVFDNSEEGSGGVGIAPSVDFGQFVKTLAVFLPIRRHHPPHRTREEIDRIEAQAKEAKLAFVFSLYDTRADGVIDGEELYTVLKMMVTDGITEAQLSFIVDQTMQEADTDGDGNISFDEFRKVLEHTDLDSRMTIAF